jgi:hypothetical protein
MEIENPQSDPVNYDTLLEAAHTGPGLQALVKKHKLSSSPQIVGSLLGVITECRRHGPTTPAQALLAFMELLESVDLSKAGHCIPAAMLGILHSAIYEDGLPEGIDYKAIAEFVHRATSQDPTTFPGRIDDWNTGAVDVCAGLACRNLLIPVLATRPGAREEMILNFQVILFRFVENTEGSHPWIPDVRFVIEALQAPDGLGNG